MSISETPSALTHTEFPTSAPDLVLRVGFLGKRELDRAPNFSNQKSTIGNQQPVRRSLLARRLVLRSLGAGGSFSEAGAEIKRIHSIHQHRTRSSWTLESLHLSEKVANDFVQEVAEWSALYAKELVEV